MRRPQALRRYRSLLQSRTPSPYRPDGGHAKPLDIFVLMPHLGFDIVKGGRVSDGDVFCRVAAIRWRAVAAAFRDGLGPAACGERISRAAARDLRSIGGLTSPEIQHWLRVGGVTGPPEPTHVERVLEHLVRTRATDRVLPLLVGSQFPTYSAAEVHLQACLAAAQLRELAASACRHPDGAGVRRPRRRRKDLAALLNDAAPLGAKA